MSDSDGATVDANPTPAGGDEAELTEGSGLRLSTLLESSTPSAPAVGMSDSDNAIIDANPTPAGGDEAELTDSSGDDIFEDEVDASLSEDDEDGPITSHYAPPAAAAVAAAADDDSSSDIIEDGEHNKVTELTGSEVGDDEQDTLSEHGSDDPDSTCEEAAKLLHDAKHQQPFDADAVQQLLGTLGCVVVSNHLSRQEQLTMKHAVDYVFQPGDLWTKHALQAIYSAFPELVDETLSGCFLKFVTMAKLIRQKLGPHALSQVLEFSAGKAWITRECLRRRLRAVCFDKLFSEGQDCNTDPGFRRWLGSVMCTVVGAVNWDAPECKTWVWVSRGTYQRSREQWRGAMDYQKVRDANSKAVRVTAKNLLAHFLGLTSLLEQPRSSLYNFIPFFHRYMEVAGSIKSSTYLGSFGAPSEKAVKILHTCRWGTKLKRKKPAKGTKQQLVVRKGRKVTGRKDKMAASAAYPRGFGFAVAALAQQHLQRRGAF